MTRKDFIAIAEAIRVARNRASIFAGPAPSTVMDIVSEELANTLAATNPAFKRERFLAACKPGGRA